MFIESSLRRSPSTDAFGFQNLADVVDFVLGQIGDLLVRIRRPRDGTATLLRVRPMP